MIKLTSSQEKAKEVIWHSLSECRGTLNPQDGVKFVLLMLLWSKLFPKTQKNIIGYFDLFETLDRPKFECLVKNLNKESEVEIFKTERLLGEIAKDSKLYQLIDSIRARLLPAAKLLIKGNQEDTSFIIDILVEFFKENFSKIAYPTLNSQILDFSDKVFEYLNENEEEINCLYEGGIASAHVFAKKRKIFTNPNNVHNDLTRSLLALYGKPLKQLKDYKEKNITFAVPETGWNGSIPSDYYFPFKDEEDSDPIIDPNCKMIYLAHKNTLQTTIALTSLGTLFSKTKGINYFREKIINLNWLDTVILLPTGVIPYSSIQTVLLVLKKNRSIKDELLFIDFSNCKKDESAKRGNLVIADEAINILLKTFQNKKKSKISKLVSIDKIKSNNFDLNFNKYFISDEDEDNFKTLQNREVVSLDSLVEFIRPLAIKRLKKGPKLNEIMISDIDYIGELNKTVKETNVSEEFFSKAKSTFIKNGDLIISIKGTIGKVGILKKDLINTIPGPSLCLLRVRKTSLIEAEYIFQYLRSNIGQRMIVHSSQGATIPFISIKDLKGLKIPIPDLKEQKISKRLTKRSKDLIDSIQAMQIELDKSIEDGWMIIEKNTS
tara:strand:+ start:463 stop:2280 length:1818 start_codon:yes stop_codon:yes gene_type:complete